MVEKKHEELSEYEHKRLQAIADNEAKLAALGLGKATDKLIPPKQQKKRQKDVDVGNMQPTRRSLRQTNENVSYIELNDAFFRAEEKEAKQAERVSNRPKRIRSAPTSYSEEQANAIFKQEKINAKKRKSMFDAHTQKMAMSNATIPMIPIVQNAVVCTKPTVVIVNNGQKRGQCWRCGQFWALRQDDMIRSHSCVPLPVAVATSQVVLPHLPVV